MLAVPWQKSISCFFKFSEFNWICLSLIPDTDTSQGGVWMSPHPKAFSNMPIVQTPSRNFTAADVKEVVQILGKSTWGNQTGALFDKLQGPYQDLQSTPSKIKLHNWYSTGIKTGEQFIFDRDLYDGFDKAAAKTVWGDGDGLVNLLSLKQVEEVWPKDPRMQALPHAFSPIAHISASLKILGCSKLWRNIWVSHRM